MIEEKWVLVEELKVNYKIGGSGFPFLILHGWNGSSESWRKVIEILSKDFFVVCPDFPGFGRSQFPSSVWNLDNFVFWLKNFVEKLNLENFFLLGHSFGGRVAIKFSILYPEKVKKLILVSSAGIKPRPDFKTKIIFQLAKIGNAIFSPKPLARFKEKMRNLFYFLLRIKDYAKTRGIIRETLKKIIEEDLLPLLSQINQETILIWGEKDKLVPIKYAQIFKEKIKNAKLNLLPKVGHSPHLECPEKLVGVIMQFSQS